MDDTLPSILTRRRREAGMSRAAVATTLNVTRQTVGHWENGKRLPGLPHLQQLATLYRVDLGILARLAAVKNNQETP